ncbi:hypothetical protein HPB47_004605 [Ixodes persulcatus]|uniref:Uncharacterized protein n=1 Tax=Ixodes persulcatus TaxID=34615 RepID=A0AC60PG27_IXOPE|nr:hypothetical protein HPB47_004605 [Ixodes persulcatus]
MACFSGHHVVKHTTFPECILEIRYNSRLNLVAVDVRNGQTTRGLLRCTELCGIKVRAYEPLPRHCATGVIKDVDTTLTDEEITNNLSFVYLGLVRHPVTPFQKKPVQCRKCCRYGHREASYKHSPVCKRCGNTHEDRDSCTAQEKCRGVTGLSDNKSGNTVAGRQQHVARLLLLPQCDRVAGNTTFPCCRIELSNCCLSVTGP